jgi:hypothetical protein
MFLNNTLKVESCLCIAQQPMYKCGKKGISVVKQNYCTRVLKVKTILYQNPVILK